MNLVLEIVESINLKVRLLGYFIGMEGSQSSCLVRITLCGARRERGGERERERERGRERERRS